MPGVPNIGSPTRLVPQVPSVVVPQGPAIAGVPVRGVPTVPGIAAPGRPMPGVPNMGVPTGPAVAGVPVRGVPTVPGTGLTPGGGLTPIRPGGVPAIAGTPTGVPTMPGTNLGTTNGLGVTRPGVLVPGGVTPGVTVPGVTTPGVTTPGVVNPGVVPTRPGGVTPGTINPGVVPGVVAPVGGMQDPSGTFLDRILGSGTAIQVGPGGVQAQTMPGTYPMQGVVPGAAVMQPGVMQPGVMQPGAMQPGMPNGTCRPYNNGLIGFFDNTVGSLVKRVMGIRDTCWGGTAQPVQTLDPRAMPQTVMPGVSPGMTPIAPMQPQVQVPQGVQLTRPMPTSPRSFN